MSLIITTTALTLAYVRRRRRTDRQNKRPIEEPRLLNAILDRLSRANPITILFRRSGPANG